MIPATVGNLLLFLSLAAHRPEAIPAEPVPLEQELGEVRMLEKTSVPHPYAAQLTKIVVSTMGPGTPWGKYRDPADGRRYAGADSCRPCHADRGGTWAQTKMATALGKLASFKGGMFLNDARCLSCHTTGYDPGRDNGGFDEGVLAMAGVQCEACHGAGSLMAEKRDRRYIIRTVDADLCGRCHSERYGTGFCFPDYDEWKVSRHAVALTTLRRSPAAADGCLECHSADAVTPPGSRSIDLGSAATGVSCQACHDAMTRTFPALPDNNQLRKPKTELCQWCHSSRGAAPDDLPHAPQGEMLAGRGGAEFPGERYASGSMNPDLTRGCLTCHGLSDRSIPFPYQGHSFLPNILACRRCHPDLQSFDRKGVQGTVRDLLLLLGERIRDYPAGSPRGEYYRRAVYNHAFVERDRSLGIHNTEYARKLLSDSIRLLGRDAAP